MEIIIQKVNSSDLAAIAKIEEFLWNEPLESRLEKLKWKTKNLTSGFVGVAAYLEDELIGYRGIIVSEIEIKSQCFRLLHFTDAVVHEKARGMSLLKKMN